MAGAIVLNHGAIDTSQSQVTVDLSALKSDQSRRDNFIKSNTLQTSQYPTATFVPRDAIGLPSPLPSPGQATFQLLGDLTVHGVTRSVTWQVTAQFGDDSVTGDATTDVNISDFGMTPPKPVPSSASRMASRWTSLSLPRGARRLKPERRGRTALRITRHTAARVSRPQ